MFGIGTEQFIQKKYKTFDLPEPWNSFLGTPMHGFVGIVYGKSGEGKTELCVRMAKLFMAYDDVAWLSYEQKHGYDLQRAIIRNKISEYGKTSKGKITWYDPVKKLPPPLEGEKRNAHFTRVLKAFIEKRNRPRFIFIDSLEYTRITIAQYFELKELCEQKGVCIIFLAHANGTEPKTNVGVEIEYDGSFGILVKHYIARMQKSRLGGRGEYVIWEEEARLRDPLYFAKRDGTELPTGKNKNGTSKKPRKQRKPKEKKAVDNEQVTAKEEGNE